MATKAAHKRLSKEYIAIKSNPVPYIIARPLENNILEWHYVIRGPPNTPYHNGEYHGVVQFPVEYPFKPPSIRMTTPSGRFQPNTKLCLSMSDFHPSSWNPSWSVATILNGLLSFMTGDETTTGSIKTSDADKIMFASNSHQFNMKSPKFREVFPELCISEPVLVEILYPLNNNNTNNNDGHDNKSSTNSLNETPKSPQINNQIKKRQINQNLGSNSVDNMC
ncbi:1755_t:CDS:2 [Entrophospora sp. SA101]|nr:1755_t:CDS:2 [Entrophospora sp. SA101]